MGGQLTFKTRDGTEKKVALTYYQSILDIKCPVDGTKLVHTIGEEEEYTTCMNCGRHYDFGYRAISNCTQEKVNQLHTREILDTREKLENLRKEFKRKESELCNTIKDLENPFTQD